MAGDGFEIVGEIELGRGVEVVDRIGMEPDEAGHDTAGLGQHQVGVLLRYRSEGESGVGGEKKGTGEGTTGKIELAGEGRAQSRDLRHAQGVDLGVVDESGLEASGDGVVTGDNLPVGHAGDVDAEEDVGTEDGVYVPVGVPYRREGRSGLVVEGDPGEATVGDDVADRIAGVGRPRTGPHEGLAEGLLGQIVRGLVGGPGDDLELAGADVALGCRRKVVGLDVDRGAGRQDGLLLGPVHEEVDRDRLVSEAEEAVGHGHNYRPPPGPNMEKASF